MSVTISRKTKQEIPQKLRKDKICTTTTTHVKLAIFLTNLAKKSILECVPFFLEIYCIVVQKILFFVTTN